MLPLVLAGLCCAAPCGVFAQKNRPPEVLKWDLMDLGPFQAGCVKVGDQVTAKGIAINVGRPDNQATMLFDPELMRVSAAWTGGSIRFPRGRGGLEGQIAPEGEVVFTTSYLPGWSSGEIKGDPREAHQGNLPKGGAKYRGLYLNGEQVVLSYTVGATPVLELPAMEMRAGARVFTRTISVGKSAAALNVLLGELPNGAGRSEGMVATSEEGGRCLLAGVSGGPAGSKVAVEGNRAVLKLPALSQPATFQICVWAGEKAAAPGSADWLKPAVPLANLPALTKGGPARWGAPLETEGRLGTGQGAYVVDEITLPEDNPFESWLRPGAHDFFPNGDAALVNLSGDVWLVSGLDAELKRIKWKRFATGLFQPLGCKVVDGKIYVLGRDQITRLHDLNGDGEADYYECFNNDCVVTSNYHEFALDLQTDAAGNFYYGKGSPWEPTNTSPHQGTMLRVSKDGSKMEILATGLRAPNGLGMGPKDLLTCSDNQGHWMPANRLNIIKPGGFYGMTPAAHRTLHFKAADGTEFDANPSTEEARRKYKTPFWGKGETPVPTAGYDLPLLWMPQAVDNSPGGQVWVSGGKWGPWEGRMLHLSYGHCVMYGVSMEAVDGVSQGAVIKFPLRFPSGIMRGRFSPKDGQLYVSGLSVWQSDASKVGCFSRVRYTGAPLVMVSDLHVLKDAIQLKFTGPLDEASATDVQNYSVEVWNYKWTGEYGSPDFKVSDGTKGRDTLEVGQASLSADHKTLTLPISGLAPCMQMKIKFRIQSADGKPVEQEIHNTIHRVPGAKAPAK